ncbi:MAG: hypothetical protein HYT09_01690 [Candidatus Levybacteria bacterium]|nr:hypothetical protein [Candidatus Levybacteria bacterium]
MKREDLAMNFEHAVRQFLGDKAYHIADSAFDDTSFRQWLRKCIPIMRRKVNQLDTTTRHKEMLMSNIEELNDRLKAKGGSSEKGIIITLFWIISRLFGFDGVSGKIFNEPFYTQTYWQYLEEKSSWNSKKTILEIDREERQNIISIRKRLIKSMKNDGLSDIKIAEVFNMGEKQIKKLKNDI